MKRIKLLITSIAIMLASFAPLVPLTAHATISDGLTCGALLDPSKAGSTDATCVSADPTSPSDKVNGTVKLVINMFSIIVGIVAVIMIVIGGLKYITSAGDAKNVTAAKNTILYAIVGLVVVALAQFIVRFVLGKVNS